ncbi:MAG: S46 family peptidase [Bacteroidota bacterium]
MKKLILFLSIFTLSFTSLKADEGMWLPMLIQRLNYVDMQKMGLQLTAEEIYSVNHSSLKDAIIQFGNGCTGEIISKQGLLITNHHCGYGSIQGASTVEHDYLTNGFWAMSQSEEIPIPGLTVKFLVRMDDVSKRVMAELPAKLSEKERNDKLQEIFKKIQAEETKGTNYEAVVKSFFDGNEFYLFVYEIFKDVRLAGAPPSSIGKFGTDTDNWMWPRHTGDFSMFRVYMSKDGKPAAYAKENVPYTPKHSLPISIKGVKKDDFAMIMGYPGTTDRFLTSYGVNMAIEQSNPTIVNIRAKKLEIMRSFMDKSDAVRIQYAAKYASIANYWKFYIGQTKGLKRLKVYDQKQQIENDFTTWVNQDNSRKVKYGNALSLISSSYTEIMKYNTARYFYVEALLRGSEIITLARSFEGLYKELKSDTMSKARVDKLVTTLKESSAKFYKDFYAPLDQILLAEMFKMSAEKLEATFQPSIMKTIAKKYKNNFDAYAAEVFKSSIFTDKTKLDAFLAKPSYKALDKDLAYTSMQSLFAAYKIITDKLEAPNGNLAEGNRKFVAGVMEMQPNKKFAPNANSTMRLTYGKVLDYYPADAVHYEYYTTLAGIMEKEDPSNWEFVVHKKLKELYQSKDYGRYGENGVMKTDFITNNDITGGNSGSPVLDGKGNLIGLAFDGNWEAMSGNIAFEPDLQRTINVDIRYVLFIIDKFAGAKNLINEMELVEK